MTPNELFSDERAVSPVVAAALLIGITALLSTAVALAMFGTDLGQAEQPEVTLSFSVEDVEGNDTVVVFHEGGEALDPDDVVVVADGDREFQFVVLEGGEPAETNEDLTAGESAVVAYDAENTVDVEEFDEVTVVWQNPRPGNDTESVLGTFRV